MGFGRGVAPLVDGIEVAVVNCPNFGGMARLKRSYPVQAHGPAPFLTSRSTTVAPSVHRRKYRRGPRAADAERRVVGSDGGPSDDRAMGATTKPGLLARPLVDRLVES